VSNLLKNILLNTALLLAPLLVLEGAFRFLPVAYLPQIQRVSAETPVARFEPNVDYRYSRDWNFSVVTRKRSNNYGFINAADYHPEERSPLLTVIGDSLVEANQVATGESSAAGRASTAWASPARRFRSTSSTPSTRARPSAPTPWRS
jgi:hypothetical protein